MSKKATLFWFIFFILTLPFHMAKDAKSRIGSIKCFLIAAFPITYLILVSILLYGLKHKKRTPKIGTFASLSRFMMKAHFGKT